MFQLCDVCERDEFDVGPIVKRYWFREPATMECLDCYDQSKRVQAEYYREKKT